VSKKQSALKKNQPTNRVLLLGILTLLLVGGIFTISQTVLVKKTRVKTAEKVERPANDVIPNPLDISNNLIPSKSIEGWIELSGSVFSLSFPTDWILDSAAEDLDSYFGQQIRLTSPSRNTQLVISPGTGWDVPVNSPEGDKIAIQIGNKKGLVKLKRYNEPQWHYLSI